MFGRAGFACDCVHAKAIVSMRFRKRLPQNPSIFPSIGARSSKATGALRKERNQRLGAILSRPPVAPRSSCSREVVTPE